MTSPSAHFSARQRLILFVLLGAGFMLSVDFSILNVALPDVGAGVGLGLTGLPWITSAYALPAAGFTLLFGRLADLFGRRRLFLSGMVLLTGASMLGGFAANPEMLLTARALQGLATAMTIPAALSLLTTTFAEGGYATACSASTARCCPAASPSARSSAAPWSACSSWRAAFFINVPVAASILLVTPFVIGESRLPRRVKLDLPGAVTVTGGLLAVIYAVIEKSILAAVGRRAAAGRVLDDRAAFAGAAGPGAHPPRPTVKWGNYAGFVIFTMEPAMIFLMTLYLQKVLGFSPLATGLIFGVPGLAAVAAGVIAGRFIGRFGTARCSPWAWRCRAWQRCRWCSSAPTASALAILIPALFIGFFAHVTSIVAYTVTGTSGLPDGSRAWPPA